jgi:hypothetical protein
MREPIVNLKSIGGGGEKDEKEKRYQSAAG